MTSLRGRTVRSGLKFSKFLSEGVTASNLEKKRRAYSRLGKLFPVSPSTKILTVKGDGFNGEWIDVPGARPDKVVLYFHGGGFVFGSFEIHRDLISRIAKAGKVRAFSVDYSLSPENPYPAPINEAVAAYRWLLKSFGPSGIVVAGDSSGGSITLSLLHVLREQKLPHPACAIVISPATDAYGMEQDAKSAQVDDFFIKYENINFFVDSYFQETPRNHPVASPLYGSLRGFPPLLIHADKSELMYGQSERLARKARQDGVEVAFYEGVGLWHVWHLFARYVPEARAAIREIGKFIRQHIPETDGPGTA